MRLFVRWRTDMCRRHVQYLQYRLLLCMAHYWRVREDAFHQSNHRCTYIMRRSINMNRTSTLSYVVDSCRISRLRRYGTSFIISVFSLCSLATQAQSQDPLQLKQLILDAQAANIEKFESGTMEALVTVTHKGRASLRMDSKVRWKGKTRYWEYRISDPGAIYRPPKSFDAPLEESPMQYMLRSPDKVITADSKSNKIVIQSIGPTGRFARSELFDITPDPLWTVCCSPYLQDGPTWKVLFDKPLGKGISDPMDEIHFEQLDTGLIRLETRRPTEGYLATFDFSLPFSGNLVRLASQTEGRPEKRWSIINEWSKEGDVVRLVRSRTFLGGKDDSTADIILDVQVRSMNPGVGDISLSLDTIIAKMPKNVQIADLIHNRTTYADPRAKGEITDVQLRSLLEIVKKGEFLK